MKRRKEKQRKHGGIFSLVRRRANRLFGRIQIKDGLRTQRKMTSNGNYGSEAYNSLMGFGSGVREPGARRKKFAGYLKAANELRQTYVQSNGSYFGGSRDTSTEHVEDTMPGAFPDAQIVRGGDEEMIIFPSYAGNHVKRKREPNLTPSNGHDQPDPYAQRRDPDYWRYQEERYEEEVDAIVDVNVRGWLYSPHRGPMNRKQRLFIGLARQLSGIPAPPTSISPNASRMSSRSSSPHTTARASMISKHEEEEVSREAEAILRKGEKEADIAGRGGYSEPQSLENSGITRTSSREDSLYSQFRRGEPQPGQVPHPVTNTSLQTDENGATSTTEKRESWSDPAKMSPEELVEANNHLLARLRPFLANPLVDVAVSAFFYNETSSEQRTITTDTSGHFNFRAALTFVPTHVRLLASEGGLSVLQEVHVTQSQGVSLISDIDDTIKHSAINSGAKEIFRNTFIRSLSDLTVEGVREWYKRMADLGVKLHYVSNSPWQLYPLLTSYFAKAQLPPGSFHLKQYAGVLQGIFEPVAERKKSSMDKIMRDFPDRQFILVGDSGEADLEVYTETVMQYPGRILGVFIRDVTTSKRKKFFDSAMGPLRSDHSPNVSTNSLSPNGVRSSGKYTQKSADEDDPDLEAAIAASLEDVEKRRQHSTASIESSRTTRSGPPTALGNVSDRRPNLPPRRPSEPPAPESHRMGPSMGNLIDLGEPALSDDQHPGRGTGPDRTSLTKTASYSGSLGPERRTSLPRKSPSPAPPPKPLALRSINSETSTGPANSNSLIQRKPPPPPSSRKSFSSAAQNQDRQVAAPPPLPLRNQNSGGYGAAARQKISETYNALPSPTALWSTKGSGSRASSPQRSPPEQGAPRQTSLSSIKSEIPSKATPPPPPPRRAISSYPAAAAQYASKRLSWTSPPGSPKLSGAEQDPNEPPLSQRERAWRERWARAKQTLEEQGVVLRTWRVGFDAMDDAVALVQRALRDIEQGNGLRTPKRRV
ncbi:MAG: hypothetical protein M1820_007972 [Bogoriella megaspora]|nr:MAG: hypothetical protein M1820_007972 [Bogoriella megaspora]